MSSADRPSSALGPISGAPSSSSDPAPDRLSRALEEVLTRFGRMVAKIGARHGLPGPEVDQLVQEVRIRLWRTLREREKIEQVSASYVYRTATSAAVDLIRRRRAKGGTVTVSAEEVPALSARRRELPEYGLERDELARDLERALDSLADTRRAAVRMYLAGYDRHEIAELMGWSEAKARNLLYRGLTDVRAALAERGVAPQEER